MKTHSPEKHLDDLAIRFDVCVLSYRLGVLSRRINTKPKVRGGMLKRTACIGLRFYMHITHTVKGGWSLHLFV